MQYCPDVVIVTETWLQPEIGDSELIPPTYNILRKDRSTRGGGVAIIFRKGIGMVEIKSTPENEIIWCKATLGGALYILGAVYRPPSAPIEFLESMQDFLCNNVPATARLIIAGDFNLPGIQWDELKTGNVSTKHCEVLLDIAFSNDLTQVVNEATRLCTTRESLLDLVFINSKISDYEISVHDGLSDHKLVLFRVKNALPVKNKKRQTVLVYDFSRADDVSILDYLEMSLYGFDGGTDVNVLWNQFKSIVQYSLSKFVPKRQKTVKKQNPWVNRDIIHLKRQLKRKKKNRNRKQSEISHLSQILRDTLKAAKEKYYSHTLAGFMKDSPQRLWRHLATSNKDTSCIVDSNSGDVITDPSQIADQYNNFFHSVFAASQVDEDIESASNCAPRAMNDIVITEEGILSLVLNVDTKKSAGPDGIPNEFLRRYAEWVSKYLLIIFSASLEQHSVPQDWLIARVVPIHKSGDKHRVENYRPISITCTCCKILEHILSKSLFEYFESFNILSPSQHGFRKRLSTVTQLTETIHDLAAAIDQRSQIDAICLDLSKAFDRVSHSQLLTKLFNYGVHNNMVKWVKAYLSNRKQFVEFKGARSEMLPVTSGVPQGSVLSPVLFLCYINDIAEGLEKSVTLRLFADDCLMYSNISCQEDQIALNSAVKTVSDWCEKWKMKINYDKTVYTTITKRTKNVLAFNYQLNGKLLSKTSHFKYLGVTISHDLNWKLHINNLCSSAEKKLWFLRRKLKGTPSNLKLTAYLTLVRPMLEYASVVWSPFKKNEIDKLERIQRRAARFILSKYSRKDSVTAMLTQLNLPTLSDRRAIARLKFLHLFYTKSFNIKTERYIQKRSSRPVRRSSPDQIMPMTARTDIFKYSFFPHTIEAWNRLPPEITQLNSVGAFERAVSSCIAGAQ